MNAACGLLLSIFFLISRPLIVVGHLTRFDELVERKEMEALTARPAVAPGAEQSGSAWPGY